MGEVLYAKGDYKAAEQYYKKSVTKAPKEELASKYILLGDYYLENLQDYKKKRFPALKKQSRLAAGKVIC